jgi:hypothetical protein
LASAVAVIHLKRDRLRLFWRHHLPDTAGPERTNEAEQLEPTPFNRRRHRTLDHIPVFIIRKPVCSSSEVHILLTSRRDRSPPASRSRARDHRFAAHRPENMLKPMAWRFRALSGSRKITASQVVRRSLRPVPERRHVRPNHRLDVRALWPG